MSKKKLDNAKNWNKGQYINTIIRADRVSKKPQKVFFADFRNKKLFKVDEYEDVRSLDQKLSS